MAGFTKACNGASVARIIRILWTVIAAFFSVLVALTLALIWHFACLRQNRIRAIRILRFVDLALAGEGHLTGVTPVAPDHFLVSVQLGTSLFRRPAMLLSLAPRHDPMQWLLFWLRRRRETLVFQTDLEIAPAFNFHGKNQRWLGRTGKHLALAGDQWDVEAWAPCVISTRAIWRAEQAAIMNALFSSRHQEVLSVEFRRSSPHFSAALPLDSLPALADQRPSFFDSLRALASEASASRM